MITCNERMMGYLNSFSARGGRDLKKDLPKIQMPGRVPGEGRGGGEFGSFDLTNTLSDIPRICKDDTSHLEVACSVLPALE